MGCPPRTAPLSIIVLLYLNRLVRTNNTPAIFVGVRYYLEIFAIFRCRFLANSKPSDFTINCSIPNLVVGWRLGLCLSGKCCCHKAQSNDK